MEPGFENISSVLYMAVYILCYKGKVTYIGQSSTPFKRFAQHKITNKSMMTSFGPKMGGKIPFDTIWLKSCRQDEANELEEQLIRKYKPKYNVKHNSQYNKEPYEKLDIKALLATIVPNVVRQANDPHPTILGPINRRI